jgi:N utilization substance protein B
MSTPSPTPGSQDSVRELAFTGIYLLAGNVEAGGVDGEEELAKLAPEQRDRAINMAARRLAFQLLYELDQTRPGDGGAATVVREALKGVADLGPAGAEDIAGFVEGAYAQRGTADAEFAALAPEWPTHRQAAVDRALLRLAHYEITSGRTPARVVVNETVELAKHFSTEKAPAFVNALLDKVMKRVAGGAGGAVGG